MTKIDRLVHILTYNGKKIAENSINCKKNIVPLDFEVSSIKIINIVCDYYDVDVSNIRSRRDRLDKNIVAKQMAIYFIKSDFPKINGVESNQEIGKLFNIHRTSALHGYKKIRDLLDVDKMIRRDYQELRERINLIYP